MIFARISGVKSLYDICHSEKNTLTNYMTNPYNSYVILRPLSGVSVYTRTASWSQCRANYYLEDSYSIDCVILKRKMELFNLLL